MGKYTDNKEQIYKKWMPIIDNFNYKNIIINRLVCLYCEWHSVKYNEYISSLPVVPAGFKPGPGCWTNDGKSDLPEQLLEIKNKITSFDKIEIIGTFFNPISGIVEYKLSNGKFIPIGDKIEYQPSTEDVIQIFGIEFLKEIDPEEFRNTQIEKIL